MRTLLEGYENWIGAMEELNDGNARLLAYAQGLLGVGIVSLATGILLVAFT